MRNRERAISLKQTVFQPRKRCGLDTAWMPWKHRMQSKEPDTGLPTAVPLARSQEAGGELPGLGGGEGSGSGVCALRLRCEHSVWGGWVSGRAMSISVEFYEPGAGGWGPGPGQSENEDLGAGLGCAFQVPGSPAPGLRGQRITPTCCCVPPPIQGEDPLAESVLTFVAQTSALTYAPASRAAIPEGHPLHTLPWLQPDELSPKAAGSVDRQRLVAALGTYAAQKAPAAPREGDPALHQLVRESWRAPRLLTAPAAPPKWPSPPDPRDAPGTDEGKSPLVSLLWARLFLWHLPRPALVGPFHAARLPWGPGGGGGEGEPSGLVAQPQGFGLRTGGRWGVRSTWGMGGSSFKPFPLRLHYFMTLLRKVVGKDSQAKSGPGKLSES